MVAWFEAGFGEILKSTLGSSNTGDISSNPTASIWATPKSGLISN